MPSSLSAKASNTLASFKHLAAAFHALSIASLIRTATSTRQHLGKRPRRAFAPHSRRLTLIGLTNTAVGCIANPSGGSHEPVRHHQRRGSSLELGPLYRWYR